MLSIPVCRLKNRSDCCQEASTLDTWLYLGTKKFDLSLCIGCHSQLIGSYNIIYVIYSIIFTKIILKFSLCWQLLLDSKYIIIIASSALLLLLYKKFKL